jgi:SAM-dependent methyltransferase
LPRRNTATAAQSTPCSNLSPEEIRALGVSPFVVRAIDSLRLTSPQQILDLPCGHGRHSLWLAKQGYAVTAADIDPALVEEVEVRLSKLPVIQHHCVVVDATKALPFSRNAFDGAVIVDYVEAALLKQIHEVVKRGGFLVYETFTGRGRNAEQLLPVGLTREILGSPFDLLSYQCRAFGLPGAQTETVKLHAVRR